MTAIAKATVVAENSTVRPADTMVVMSACSRLADSSISSRKRLMISRV